MLNEPLLRALVAERAASLQRAAAVDRLAGPVRRRRWRSVVRLRRRALS